MSNFYGLIGETLTHSMSPKIHNLILQSLSLKDNYNLFEIKRENIKDAVLGLKMLGCRGVNVTIPYKIDVIQYLDGLSKEAERIGAVNTIDFKDGRLIGYNTDYYGFGASLKRENIDIMNKNALILGTGGASKAVVQYLKDNGIREVVYVSRNPKEAGKFIKNFKVIDYENILTLKDKDIIINCTPCGMYPNIKSSPINKYELGGFSTAVDLIYNPEETVFLKMGKALGLKTVNGLYMLVSQALISQEIWQGKKIGEEVTEEIYNNLRMESLS